MILHHLLSSGQLTPHMLHSYSTQDPATAHTYPANAPAAATHAPTPAAADGPATQSPEPEAGQGLQPVAGERHGQNCGPGTSNGIAAGGQGGMDSESTTLEELVASSDVLVSCVHVHARARLPCIAVPVAYHMVKRAREQQAGLDNETAVQLLILSDPGAYIYICTCTHATAQHSMRDTLWIEPSRNLQLIACMGCFLLTRITGRPDLLRSQGPAATGRAAGAAVAAVPAAGGTPCRRAPARACCAGGTPAGGRDCSVPAQ